LRSSPVSTEAAVVPGAMVELGVAGVVPLPLRRGRPPLAAGVARAGGFHTSSFQAATGALHPLGRSHRHQQALDLLEGVVADRFTGFLFQGGPDLIVRDPAAVLGDQSDQGIGEVGEDRHQGEYWEGEVQAGRAWELRSTSA
jgi:hypothetical protein